VESPDLAVIIPARNEATRIGDCLDSVHQALEYARVTEAEVIVVDDESTDETSQVARTRGAIAVRQSPRGGPLAAWAVGVANSCAPLLFFVDADCQVDKAGFAALLRGFARPEVGVVAARADVDRRRTGDSLVERGAAFSALLMHEVKIRLPSHDFLPIGKLMAVRREAWGTGGQPWPCDRVVAWRAKQAGWEVSYAADAVVCYAPVETYSELRSDYVRTVVAHERLCTDWFEPLPPGIVRRAALASLRRQPVNAAAWAAVRARLRSERSRGQMPAGDGYARWDRRPDNRPGDHAAGRQSGVRA
jgi:glycosyltransferase involved in cell wall biosynthesis